MTHFNKGKFITIEGIEGVGKSTLIRHIQDEFTRENKKFIITKEPGGTNLGLQIRALLFQSDLQIDPVSELFLLFADRRQHFKEVIEPALDEGNWVISDRFVDSTYAYQGAGRKIANQTIETIEKICYAEFKPDLVLWLDLKVSEALYRVSNRNQPSNRFEQEKWEFFDKAQKLFQARAQKFSHIKRLDASLDERELVKKALELINHLD